VGNTYGFPVIGQRILEEFGLKDIGRKHRAAGSGKKDTGVDSGHWSKSYRSFRPEGILSFSRDVIFYCPIRGIEEKPSPLGEDFSMIK